MIRRGRVALLPLALLAATAGHAQHTPIVQRLYDGPAPGSEHWRSPERTVKTATGAIVSNVRDPELLAYLPAPDRATGRAVIILPGGGLRVLGIDRQMMEVIQRLNARGTAAFVLKYRLLQTADVPAPASATGVAAAPPRWPDYPPLAIRNANANPSPQDTALSEVLRFAVADTRRAFAMIRINRTRWKVDPDRIGMIGISAGGGVAIGTLLANDPTARPTFIASIFGPALQDVTVKTNAPPLFIVTETGHGPVTDGLEALTTLWRAARRPVEEHIFDVPPGGLANSLWLNRFIEWLGEQRID